MEKEKKQSKNTKGHNTPSEPKNSKKKMFISVAIIALVAVLAGYLGAYLYFMNKPADIKDTGQIKKQVIVLPGSAKEAIDQVSQLRLQGTILDITEFSGMNGKTSNGQVVYHMAPYKIGGKSFSNVPVESTGFATSSDNASAGVNYNSLERHLTDRNFIKVSGSNKAFATKDESIEFLDYAIYEYDDVVCSIEHVDATKTSVKDFLTSIACADMVDYEAAADSLDALFAAYTVDNKNAGDIVFGIPTVEEDADGTTNVTIHQFDSNLVSSEQEKVTTFEMANYHKAKDANIWTYKTE